ncbi:hypothetical protein LSH36_181g01012 [Paralvinella palmiformis]|uniref:COMM domain-containing protein n=1 Tax=Paralvinella palmiformis TaxID=53620 RepID=A0AAD9N7J1_9ANNE|nr:hypothetical protein LSH36_181g01012 [Paralvinella palmiformis]
MTTFHFIDGDPPESLLTDVQTMNKFETEQFEELLQIIFNFLNEPNKSSHFLEDLETFAKKNGLNAAALKGLIKTAIHVPNSALKRNLNASQLREDFVNLVKDYLTLCTKYECNLVNLSKSALSQTLTVNQLVDMEWKFGVTAASSEMDKVGNTFLQLKMAVKKGNKNEHFYMGKCRYKRN